MRWPNQEAYEGYFHDLFTTWKEFWEENYDRYSDVQAPVKANEFLKSLRGDAKAPNIKVR